MPDIDTITIRGFKSIESIDALKILPINVLIGPNGSGKSNFIDVFSLLRDLRAGQLQDYVERAGGAERVLHFGSKTTSLLNVRIQFFQAWNRYEINLRPNGSDALVPQSEFVSYHDAEADPPERTDVRLYAIGTEAGLRDPQSTAKADYIRSRLDRSRLYHFLDTGAASPMKKTGYINDNRLLRSDGSNLAAFLYYLRERHGDSYDLVRKTAQLAAPFFDDFVLEPLKLNPDTIKLEWRHKGTDAYFDASMLSDGTLRFIALATVFLQPEADRPYLILVDEPELGLHPYAIALLASLVRQATASGMTQVILATQSPTLLDHFHPEEVLVADRVDGATQLTRLERDKLKKWLRNYSLGQLWEKNEIGGRPGAE